MGSGAGEDCAAVYVGDGGDGLGNWNDFVCDGLHTVLCEDAPTP